MKEISIQYKEKSKKSFDKKAANYNNTSDGKYCLDMYNTVLKKINTQHFKSILDVGCGTGTVLAMVRKEYDVEIYGIDLSEAMIKKARELLGDTTDLRVGDSENLPWKDNSFDVIVCNASFHHYPNPIAVLKEMRRVLKSGGRVIIADPWWPNPGRLLMNLLLPYSNGGDVKIYSEKEMTGMLGEAGFMDITWEIFNKANKNRFSIATAAVWHSEGLNTYN